MEPEDIKVGQRLYFFDFSFEDRKCIVAEVRGRDVYFKGPHGKLSSPFLCDWLRPAPPDRKEKQNA